MAEVFVVDALARAASEELRKQTQEWSTHHALRRWHLTQVGDQSVRRVRERLDRFGFESYYPMTLVSRAVAKMKLSHAQRANAAMFRTHVREPLFGSYLFVRVDIKIDQWSQAFREAGVYGIACSGRNAPYDGNLASKGELMPISCDELVDRLRSREDDGAIPGTTRLSDLFEIGEQVRVASGPFRQFHGTIADIDAKDVATVLVQIFGRSTPVKLEFSDFEKL